MKKLISLWLICLGFWSFGLGQTQYLIETIEVAGRAQDAATLLIGETRLRENQTYTERELRAAMDRLQRLAFILGADYEVAQGTEKGKYKLVIKVKMQSRIFGQIDSRYTKVEDRDSFWQDVLSVGGNYFFGKSSQIYATFFPRTRVFGDISQQQAINVGYTNYHVLDSNLFLNLDFTILEDRVFPTTRVNQEIIPSLMLGYYLGKDQWLQASGQFDNSETVRKSISENGSDLITKNRNVILNLSWIRNTTDDSWQPTRGSIFRVGASHLEFDRNSDSNQLSFDSSSWDASFFYEKNLSLGRFQVLSGRGTLRYSEADFANGQSETETKSLDVGGTYKIRILDRVNGHLFADSAYIGLNLGAIIQESERTGRSGSNRTEDVSTGAFLAYRGKWGTARLSGVYVFDE